MKTRYAALALCLTTLSLLSCLDSGRPDILDISLIPMDGPPGTEVLVQIEAAKVSGRVWAITSNFDTQEELGRVNCKNPPGSTGIFVGTWTVDTAGLNRAEYIDFEAHAQGFLQEAHGVSRTFRIIY